MKEGKQWNLNKKIMIIAAITVLVVLVGWLILAVSAGMFIPNDKRFAVELGKFSPDAMSANKKVADLKNMQVEYVDIGSGDPEILLHSCPFSVFEWKDVAPYSQAALNFFSNGNVANEASVALAQARQQ
jgi:hypothetical protein